jgi:8-oxo-dGTP pyrophosphatase MutT (NUDIX family)
MTTVPPWFYSQAASIPLRMRDGRVEVLLITTRGRRRWIIPKGVIDPGRSAEQTAADEAFEEAGVRGRLDPVPLGTYEYGKWGGTCRVTVYLMRVTEVIDSWPEQADRERRWVAVDEAASTIREPEVGAMIRQAADALRPKDQDQ